MRPHFSTPDSTDDLRYLREFHKLFFNKKGRLLASFNEIDGAIVA